MTREPRLLNTTLAAIDAVAALGAFAMAYALRSGPLGGLFAAAPADAGTYAWIAVVAIPVVLLLDAHEGVHASPLRKTPRQIVLELLRSHGAAALLLAALVFLFQQKTMSRAIFALFFAILFALSASSRLAARAILLRTSRYARRRAVLVGGAESVAPLADLVRRHPEIGVDVAGHVTENGAAGAGDLPRLGPIGRLADAVRESRATDVVFCVPLDSLDRFEDAALAAERAGAATHAALAYSREFLVRAHVDDFHSVPAILFRPRPASGVLLATKRAIDAAGAAALLVALSPLLLLVAALVRLTSRGPILYRQTRCGRDGRPFVLFKFRSMVADADARSGEVRHLNRMEGPVFKAKDDPRVTPAGRILRKFSLDELPQLVNVLRGDMSLVGPRPPLPDEVARYAPWQRRRLAMKPGLTGLWQVSGRNRIDSFEDWARLDLYYIDRWSPGLDLQILARTVPVVLLGRGGL